VPPSAPHEVAGRHRPTRRLSVRVSVLAALAVAGLSAAALPLALSPTPAVSAASSSTTTDGLSARPANPVAQVGPGTPRGDSKRISLEVDGLERAYFLLPALGLAPDEPASLLVVLHQDVSSGREISVDLGLDTLRRHGVTLAYPNGFGGSWNSGACCGIAAERGVDDVGFVNRVIEDVARHTPIDPDRRALLGYSGGGMLAYRLLCLPHPPLIAAVEINGSLEAHCANGLELPDLLSIHGEKDGSVGLTRSRQVNHLGMAPRSVVSTLSTITGQAGCGERRTSSADDVAVWRWSGCRGGGTVEAHVVPDAGHGWADVGGAERALTWLLPRLAR
jgi:polyhydroxybutyrate depolymerase